MNPTWNADVRERCRRPERMDQPDLAPTEHEAALRGLGRINVLSRSSRPLWHAVRTLAASFHGAPIRVLDLASGGGDVPLALAERARRSGLPVEVVGCDVSPTAVHFAQAKSDRHSLGVRFFQTDVLHESLPDDFDVVTCSLFLHHLDRADAVTVLAKMASATRRLVLVNDLVRSRIGYVLAWLGCRLLSRSPVVHFDGPTSVAAAFTRAEAGSLARDAGLHGAIISRCWPMRFLLRWSKP